MGGEDGNGDKKEGQGRQVGILSCFSLCSCSHPFTPPPALTTQIFDFQMVPIHQVQISGLQGPPVVSREISALLLC